MYDLFFFLGKLLNMLDIHDEYIRYSSPYVKGKGDIRWYLISYKVFF